MNEPQTIPLKVTVDTTELEAAGTLLEGKSLELLPGRPIGTIATIALVVALVLGAIVAAVAAFASELPPGFDAEAIVRWNGVAAAAATGLLTLARALLAVAKALALPRPLPVLEDAAPGVQAPPPLD